MPTLSSLLGSTFTGAQGASGATCISNVPGASGATGFQGATGAGLTGATGSSWSLRVSSAASASSVTPNMASFDQYAFTALAADLTINAPTGSPVDGTKLLFRILDNGTSRNLTWNATYTSVGITLPLTTTANKTTYVGCVYNTNNTRWDVVAVSTQL